MFPFAFPCFFSSASAGVFLLHDQRPRHLSSGAPFFIRSPFSPKPCLFGMVGKCASIFPLPEDTALPRACSLTVELSKKKRLLPQLLLTPQTTVIVILSPPPTKTTFPGNRFPCNCQSNGFFSFLSAYCMPGARLGAGDLNQGSSNYRPLAHLLFL